MSLKKIIKGIINDVNDIIESMEHKQQNPDSPDINELVKRVVGDIPDRDLEEISDSNDDEYEELWKMMDDDDYYQEKMLKQFWSENYVVLDSISDNWRSLPDSELLDAEISASVNELGGFILRSSMRAYQIEHNNDDFREIPADTTIIRHFKELAPHTISQELSRSEYRDVHIFHELHFRLKSGGGFKLLAKAKVPRSMAWTEEISGILLAKESKDVPDEKASLIAHVSWMGSSYSTDTWYKADASGNITRLHLSGYGNSDDRFVECNDR